MSSNEREHRYIAYLKLILGLEPSPKALPEWTYAPLWLARLVTVSVSNELDTRPQIGYDLQ